MVKNEVGIIIPDNILKKAQKMGCLHPKYIYKDGEYGSKCPASNLGGGKSTRFHNMESANKHKITIENDWVIFESPKYAEQKSLSRIKDRKNEEPKIIQHFYGDIKTEIKDSVVTKSEIGIYDKKALQICPYCGEKLDFSEPPKYCPYSEKQIQN